MFDDLIKTGKKCVDSGLVEGNFGNMSFVSSDRDLIFITKTETLLDDLSESDIVCVSGDTCLENSNEFYLSEEKQASSELCVHRAIYKKTNAKCVLHLHPPYSVVVSLLEYQINNISASENFFIHPMDSEGEMFLKKIPVVSGAPGSLDLAEKVSQSLKGSKGVIVKGHGVFVAESDFKKAYITASLIEHSARILYLYNSAYNKYI